MDKKVIAAMARWPDVPDVFGWLSLNVGGHWRLHPAGDALNSTDGGTRPSEGVPITSTSINQFINRNYARDAIGRWFFQNGPQRVYVRLDAAPYIFHTTDPKLIRPTFQTHNGLRASAVLRWCLDEQGYLYVDTDLGPGLVASRDLAPLMDRLATVQGESLLQVLDGVEAGDVTSVDVCWNDGAAAPLYVCRFDQVPDLLGFARYPRPE